MTPDAHQQYDLFTRALVATQPPHQKRRGVGNDGLLQLEMFSQREIAQFGVTAHPHLPLSPHTALALMVEDLRTDEEQERDAQRAAEEQTHLMFAEAVYVETSPPDDMPEPRHSLFRVETQTNLEGMTRHYLYEGDELLVMTPGAMYWNEKEVAAQRDCAVRIATVLNHLIFSFVSAPRLTNH